MAITIFTGHYGSGKTELSIHTALLHAPGGVLVDLDIVNPYFRSAEQIKLLESHGVEVIKPTFANTAVDIPALPAQVLSIFEKSAPVVMDVGGDVTGATALGRYYPYFQKAEYHMLYVVNIFRPMSATPEEIEEMLRAIEQRSRLKVEALVNNANLGAQTRSGHLVQGQEVLQQVSLRTGLPIRWICGTQQVIDDLPEDFLQRYRHALYPIEARMRPEWMD